MGKPSINAKAVLSDIRNGATKAELMEKYKLSPKGLESLYKKLVAAGLIPPGELTRRTGHVEGSTTPSARPPAKQRPSRGPASPRKRTVDASAKPTPQSAELRVSEQAKAIADDINAGMHDNEILRRHEISPGQFRKIKERLVQVGLLRSVESERGGSRPGASRTCPSCGQEVSAAAAKCNRCGEWFDDQAMSAPVEAPGPAERSVPRPPPPRAMPTTDEDDDFEDEEECPWEERRNYGLFSAYVQTATKCLLTPTQFFSRLPTTGGFLNPILFTICSMVVSLALAYAWTRLFTGGMGFFGLIFVIVAGMFVAALAVPIGLFLWSGILHGCLLLVGGAQSGYEATFRVVSYSSVTSLFNVIPVVGNFASLWGMVLTVIGLRETHRTSTGKAAAAVAIPLAVVVVFVVSLAVMGLFAVKSALREPAVQIELSGQELPNEVCVAIQEFLSEVDFAKNMDDPKSAREQVQQAMKSLNETLNAHSSHPDTDQVRKLATVYGLASLAQKHLKSAMPGMMPALGAAEEHREKLGSLCPE